MTFDRDPLAGQGAYLVDQLALQRELGREVTVVEIAAAVTILPYTHQSAVLAWCWFGVEPATLVELLRASRHDTVTALYKPGRNYRAAGRHFGRSHRTIAETVARGTRNLLAILLARGRSTS